MSKWSNFFKGTRPSKSRETVAELRKQASDIKIRAKALKRLSDEERGMAKDFLKDGNKGAAEKALMRRKHYQADLASLMSKAALINQVIESIAKAESNAKLLKALNSAKVDLDKTASSTQLEHSEEIMSGLEESMENVDAIDERMRESIILDDELDSDLADVSSEMNMLMSEIKEETSNKRPAAVTEKKTAPKRRILDSAGDLPEAEKGSADDVNEKELKAEIERIKKEMEEELQ